MSPGPGQYEIVGQMKDGMHLAKSMLGGSLEEKPPVDNGNPGPDAYA